MSYTAFRDKARKIEVNASDCTAVDQKEKFFCPYFKCNAVLTLCSLGGKKQPYFAAHIKPHSPDCSADLVNFNSSLYDPSSLDIDSLIEKFMAGSTDTKKRTISTATDHEGDGNVIPIDSLPILYNMCKSVAHTSSYGKYKISMILCDDRSNYLYTKIIQKKCLIECYYYRYESKTKSIYYQYPLDSSAPNQYTLRVDISDTEMFVKVRNRSFNNLRLPIVIAGDWKQSGHRFIHCQLFSHEQIHFPHITKKK